jgi:hypothetical protein
MNNFYKDLKSRLLSDDRYPMNDNPTPILKLKALEVDFKWLVLGLSPFNENEVIALTNYFGYSKKFSLPGIESISFKALEALERKSKITIVEDKEFTGNFALSTYAMAVESEKKIIEDYETLFLRNKNEPPENFSFQWDCFKPKKNIFSRFKF